MTDSGPFSPEPVFVCWEPSAARCLSCGADLEAHAQAAAWTTVVEGRAPDASPPTLVFYWIDELPTCPQCGVTRPSRHGHASSLP